MKRWGKYVPILALLTVGLFTAAPAAAQTGSVTGTILASSTGQPLDAVQVSVIHVGCDGGQHGLDRPRTEHIRMVVAGPGNRVKINQAAIAIMGRRRKSKGTTALISAAA